MTRVPSYVVKAREFLRKQMIRETPHLAEMARLRRALLRAADEHGDDSPGTRDALLKAARCLEDQISADVLTEDEMAVVTDATPPLFPE